MAQVFSQPAAQADVKVVLRIEVGAELAALLVAQGWTAPGKTPIGAQVDEQPILNSEHRRILDQQAVNHLRAMAKLQEKHRAELAQQVKNHQQCLEREEKRIREEYSARGRHDGCVTWADHTQALRERAKKTRADVAEEIAVDLAKPRAWRMTPEQWGPWADVARAHAGGKPGLLPFGDRPAADGG